jgi:c(7)-type cytochrome triheme protein
MMLLRRSVLLVLALGLAFILGLGLAAAPASAAPPPIIKVDNRKFDHDKHAQASAGAGKPAMCASCHTFDANGVRKGGREHPRCAQCHTYPRSCDLMRTAGPKGQARVCQVCHTPTSNRCLPPDLPPPPKADSFQSRFTHGKHLALGPSIEKDCAQCHATQAPAERTKLNAHRSCAGCHNPNGARPSMTDCQSCHVAPRAKTTAPVAHDPYRLGGFDHRAHHNISRQASCVGCHDKLLGAGEAALPRPSMAGCQARCHDGQKAFSAVGTRCTSCHKGRDPAVPVRQDIGFTHAAHGNRNMQIQNCAQCHQVGTDGTLTAPLAKKDHQPCATSSCHLNEFMSRTTKICGTCHESASPWLKTVSRAKPPAKSEWFERIDHAAHLSKLGAAASNSACESCHGNKLAGSPAPEGHDACAPCHGRGQGPQMAQCAACHVQTPPARAMVSTWSVRATFVHKQHANDPRARGATTKCTECHKQVATAKDLASIKAPAMADCESCHNGKQTFKTTGFECARCHTPQGEARPAPSAMRPGARGDARLAVREPGEPGEPGDPGP